MKKADLVASMAENGELSKKDAEKALNAFLQSVEEALTSGDKIQIVGFGSFEVR